MVKRYLLGEVCEKMSRMGLSPITEIVRASDYDECAAESEARHQSCLVLMKSVQDHRDRIRELEAALHVIMQKSVKKYDALAAELAQWKTMRNEAMAVATANRERIRELEAALERNKQLEKALQIIASETICPELFPDIVRTEQDYELLAKTAMTVALAALDQSNYDGADEV